MNIAVFGTGQMGHAIVFMLRQLGNYTIYTCDSRPADSNLMTDYHSVCDVKDMDHDYLHTFDLVISSLPYYLNNELAQKCIENKIPYCGLGGSVPVSKVINKSAKSLKSTVFTDLGLAPGWANIMAEEAIKELPNVPHTVKMRCGGLPNDTAPSSKDPFNYKLTWSIDGLYNEYVDECQVLKDGAIVSVPSLSEREMVRIVVPNHFRLDSNATLSCEAFTTSGGASHTLQHMKNAGILNCSYKTLRYIGHLDLMIYFLKQKKFDAEQMASLFKDDLFKDEDMVIVDVEAVHNNLTYRQTHFVAPQDGYSAMQRATAGGLVSAVMACPQRENRPLTYHDVNIEEFNNNLTTLGVIGNE